MNGIVFRFILNGAFQNVFSIGIFASLAFSGWLAPLASLFTSLVMLPIVYVASKFFVFKVTGNGRPLVFAAKYVSITLVFALSAWYWDGRVVVEHVVFYQILLTVLVATFSFLWQLRHYSSVRPRTESKE